MDPLTGRREHKASALGLLVLASLAWTWASGCSTKVEVSSDGCWTGAVNGGSVQGCGPQTWEAQAGNCYVFQKSQQGGTLRARVKGWHGDGRWVETSADYGVVSVCAK